MQAEMAKDMTPQDFAGAAHDLIYTRLDLPALPSVDVEALLDWMFDKQRSVMGEQRLHDTHTRGGTHINTYPWRAVHACSDDVWDSDFKQHFPQLVGYLRHFPATSWKRVCVVCQLAGSQVFIHTDPDFGVGWRVYLNHGGPRLYFQKFKTRHSVRPQTWASGGPQGIEALCQPERHYVNGSGTYPWALTSIRAAHGVEENTAETGARVTLLLFPNIDTVDTAAHTDLLLRSARKFSDTAIWYGSETDQ
jgi:hypothetical protein